MRLISMKFRIALYPSDEGFAVCVPSLPGCWSQGATAEEATANIAEAIREYLGAETEPKEGAEVREIEVAV
jgi:predicted RNase H-like HicB family nuclease